MGFDRNVRMIIDVPDYVETTMRQYIVAYGGAIIDPDEEASKMIKILEETSPSTFWTKEGKGTYEGGNIREVVREFMKGNGDQF